MLFLHARWLLCGLPLWALPTFLGWRWAVCPPARIHEGAVGTGPLSFFCPFLSGSHHVAHAGSGSGDLRREGTPVFWQSAGLGAPGRNADQDSRARGQGSGLEKGWKKVPVPKDVKLTRPRGKVILIYLCKNMADLADPGWDSSGLRQTCRRGDRSCRPPVPRGT